VKTVKNLFQHIFGGRRTRKTSPPEGSLARIPETGSVRVDLDQLGPDAQAEFKEAVSQISEFTFFEGHVEHGYSLERVSNQQECPRCHAPTRQYYAEWIYATQIAPRLMLAPAGYFCTRCPMVIVNEAMIRSGVKQEFEFLGVVGLNHEGGKSPDFFKTWNGHKAVHIFDEQGIHQGLSTLGAGSARRSTPGSRKARSRSRPGKKGKRSRRR
jgi:hypothetical protein